MHIINIIFYIYIIMNNFKENINRTNKSYEKMLKLILPIRTDYLKIYKKLSAKEMGVLTIYKENGYAQINELLYKNTITNIEPLKFSNKLKMGNLNDIINEKYNSLKEHIEILDKILTKYKLKTETTVFRGISGDLVKQFEKLKVGNEITMPSFLSASFDPSVAFGFTLEHYITKKTKTKYLIEIKLPANTNTSYIQFGLTNTEFAKKFTNENFSISEFELLLERGSVLKLDKISTIEERFFTLDNMDWKRYLNTKNKVKKIKVYHMSLSKIDRKEVPTMADIAKKINWNKIMTPVLLKKLYYISNKDMIKDTYKEKYNKNINSR